MRVATLRGSHAELHDRDVRELSCQLEGVLLERKDRAYDVARRVFNGLFERRPALIVRCRSVADVAVSVRFAREHDLLLAVRGGGHSIAGYSTCDDGMVIDLSAMSAVTVDAVQRRVRAGGGALWAEVDRETQRVGMATPGGIVSHTGVAGLTLSGGIGWLRNAYGLSCDNLQRIELVTAASDVLTASASENADLFWAVRGGGGNFGVVTSFEFDLHPVGPEVAALFPVYPLRDARAVLTRWREWVLDAPREISSEVVLWTAPDASAFPAAARGQPVVIPSAVCAAAADWGLPVLEPLQRFGRPLGVIGGTLPYCVVQSAFDAAFPNNGQLCSYWKSLYVQQLTDAVLDTLVQAAEQRTSQDTMLVLQHIGGAVHEVAAGDSAFAVRNAPFLINLMGTWSDPQESARHTAWVRDAWRRLAALSTATVYLNYLGEEPSERDGLIRAAHGANYTRLAQLKRKYDPENLFCLNQNIPPGIGSEKSAPAS